MALASGTRLGDHEIVDLLGAGGMGEVYRAHDTRLRRDVAIKVVRPTLADRADLLLRFEREAHVLATLTHPHIATIYGAGECDGVPYLTLELVPGETLDERLAKSGRLRPSEALRLAAQIAAALDAAHERGVIHRDLKPGNIKITPDGTVKVLDFGLAKLLTPEGAAPDLTTTVIADATREGATLGTPAYMSPEQTRGQLVDKRTDVWAFGCVLYQMLTGRPPFLRDTVSDTLVQILEHDPPWDAVAESTPPSIVRLLKRCLEKDARRRLRDMGDALVDMDEAIGTLSSGAAVAKPAPRARRVERWWIAVAFLIGAIMAGTLVRWMSGEARVAPRPVARFVVDLPAPARLAGTDFPAVALSPNGTHLVFVATRGGRPQLFLRSLDSLDAIAIAGTEEALSPFFSPDGQWIGFFAGGKLKKISISGGAPITLADAPIGFGGSWGSNDVVVFAPNNGSELWKVSANGGAAESLTRLDAQNGEFSHRWPDLLPNGKAVLFAVGTVGSWDAAQIVAQEVDTGRRHVLVRGGTQPRYVPSGHLVFARNGSLMAVPFDAATLRVSGTPARAIANVMESFDGAGQFSVSSTGSVLYAAGAGSHDDRSLVWVDHNGRMQPLAAPPRSYAMPRLSPDGRLLAVTISDEKDDVWLYDMSANAFTQLTFEGSNSAPVWSPDGSRIAFGSGRDGPSALFWKPADASSPSIEEERLAQTEFPDVPHAWFPDGRGLVFVELRPTTGRDIWLLSLDRDPRLRPLLQSTANETAAAVSPDGRWLAYVSDESGGNEVYVVSTSGEARKRRVSTDGGAEPVWSRDGRELFYRAGARMMAARMEAASPAGEKPRVVFEGTYESGVAARPNYDIALDSRRFLMVKPGNPETATTRLTFVLNWIDELRRPSR